MNKSEIVQRLREISDHAFWAAQHAECRGESESVQDFHQVSRNLVNVLCEISSEKATGEERPGLVVELRNLERAAGMFSRRCEAQGEVRAAIQVVTAVTSLKRARVALGCKRRGASV